MWFLLLNGKQPTKKPTVLCCTGCESYLSHLASIEEIFHHEQVQFLLRVVLGVLVTNPVNTQDLCQRCRSLWYKVGCY